jgi:hypothetical protein
MEEGRGKKEAKTIQSANFKMQNLGRKEGVAENPFILSGPLNFELSYYLTKARLTK